MSANKKVKIRSTSRKASRRVRISCSNCKSNGNIGGDRNRSCGKKQDPAVEGVQEAGKVLGDFFKKLKCEDNAETLVKAIRCRNEKAIECLLGCNCKVVCFFSTRDKDCVRICCSFGRWNDVTVTFDICIRKLFDPCDRRGW
ncbi:hypothetical protein KP806_15325 [Paenibacillus sp. N4]|uniref:hypothetical protein n=1 Tax=Paenibacillus vietnamensis TaxID=2590547 RepID=UPI001CD04A46|nr:hypothetical protein [Paenibacillus vietnamensis]MCA0756424.1 hypothetical protein [Paenibacillus vietnamensis]